MNEDLAKLLVRAAAVYLGIKALPRVLEWLDSIEFELPQSPPQRALPPPQVVELPAPSSTRMETAPPPPTAALVKPLDLEGLSRFLTLPQPTASEDPPPPPTPTDYALAQVLPPSGVIIATGGRGSGKTGVIARMQELLKDRLLPYAVGLPAGAVRLLPHWYGLADDISAVPNKAGIYLPESHRDFHARTTQSAQGRGVGDIVNLVRHRQWLLFFDVQNLAHLDRNILSEADVLLIKEPGPFNQGFDRPQFREHIEAARAAFSAVGPARRKRAVWVVAPAAGIHGKLMENALPTFWSDALSRAFANTRPGMASESPDKPDTGAGVIRRAEPATPADLRRRAKQLRAAGHSYGEIAKMLGASKTQVYRLVNED